MKDARRDLLDIGWDGEPVGLAYLFGVLRRQLLVLILAPLVFLVLGLAYLILAEPIYSATASIRVQVDDPAATLIVSPLDTHVELIQSDRITSSVIEELRLGEVLETTPGRLRQMIADARDWLDLDADDSWSNVDEQSFLIRQVQAGLSVQQVGNTSIITVSYTSPQRSLSVEVANAFAATYVNDVSEAASGSVERRTDLLRRRADEVRQLASSADEVGHRLLSQGDIMVASAEDLEARVAELRQQLTMVNASEAEVRARLSLSLQAEDADALEAAALQTDETTQMYNDMMSASSALAQLEQQSGVSGDTIARLEESIAGMRASLDRVVRRNRQELELELAVITARRSSLLNELNEMLDYSRSTAWSNLIETQRRAELYEGMYQEYLSELESVSRGDVDSDVRLVSEARPPVDPSFPKYKVHLVLAVTIGFAVGGGIAAYREWGRNHTRMRARGAGHGGRQPL
jgi:succinoglycan biosynthesis transport protein ExoP